MEINKQKNRTVYIVISQTGSIVSKILKKITGAKYNHSSIALDEGLIPMYSFARKYTYSAFWGAFTKETPDKGALRRFVKGTQVQVIALSVTEEQYQAIGERLTQMYEQRDKYHYNYFGLFLAYFQKRYHPKHCYYCSEFVRSVLEGAQVIPYDYYGEVVKPIDFLNLPDCSVVYEGNLKAYYDGRKQAENCPSANT